MEKPKRDDSQFSKEDVQHAILFLIVAFTMIAMGISIWLLGMWMENPHAFYSHLDRIQQSISPLISLIEWIMPFVVGLVIIAAIALLVFLMWIIWKGRHHLPEIFEDKGE